MTSAKTETTDTPETLDDMIVRTAEATAANTTRPTAMAPLIWS